MSKRLHGRLASGCVRKLEILEFQSELAITFVLFRFSKFDIGLPRSGASVRPREQRLGCFFGLEPAGMLGLGQQPGIQTYVLMRRWTEVVVSEDGSQCAVLTGIVFHWIRVPALDRSLSAVPLVRCRRRAEITPTWRFRRQLRLGSILRDACRERRRLIKAVLKSRIPDVQTTTRLPVIDGGDASLDLVGRKRSVLVVEAVGRTVGGEHVEFNQMDMLSQNIGGSFHLKIVQLIIIRH